jgi:hypothetical protein
MSNNAGGPGDIRADTGAASGSEGNAQQGGTKIPLRGSNGLWARLTPPGAHSSASGAVERDVWRSICSLVTKSLLCIDDKMCYQPSAFELFGYDVLIDQDYRCWLIEVNASPSLSRENQLDVIVKNAVVRDTIKLLDPPAFDREALAAVMKRRLSEQSSKKGGESKGSNVEHHKPKQKLKKQQSDGGSVSRPGAGVSPLDPVIAVLEDDLKKILGPDYTPRKYGEMPKELGAFQRLCPGTPFYEKALKLKGKIIRTTDDGPRADH